MRIIDSLCKFLSSLTLCFGLFLLTQNTLNASPPTEKIIGGIREDATKYPYVARLFVDGQTYCSGTLVGAKHVVTAAHSFFGNRNRRVVGETDMVARLGNQSIRSFKVHIHPSFRPRSSACIEGEPDIAVIELSQLATGVTPIDVRTSQPPIGSSLFLAGFGSEGSGANGENGNLPPIGKINVGNTILEGFGSNPPSQNANSAYLFWRFNPGEANTASGDSGGPAFFDEGGKTYSLVGVTCGGEGNAQFGTYSFDTRTDKVRSWILSITGSTPANTAPGFASFKAVGASLGKAFSYTIPVTGSSPISISASGLPSGLSLSGNKIIGTPSAAGKYTVPILATNSFGSASSDLVIIISTYDPAATIRRVLLQFDYDRGARDFLDIDGRVNVGKRFRPRNKRIQVRIGKFTKEFRLRADGQSRGGGRSFLDLEGAFKGNVFSRQVVRYFLTLERVPIFAEIATLGFPNSANASEGQEVSLPLSLTVNEVESSTTVILRFSSRDARWRIKK